MNYRGKSLCGCGWVYLVVCLVWLWPASVFAVEQIDLEWDHNLEPELAGYRVFIRLEGQFYDYADSAYDGPENTCTIFIEDGTATYYFAVRAYDLNGFESNNSYEVKYDPDEPDPDNVLVLDAINGQGHVYIYVDECAGILTIDEFISVNPASIPDPFSRPVDFAQGLFRVELVLDIIGGTAMIPIKFSMQAPVDARWFTYDHRFGWLDNNSVFSDDRMSVTLWFKDGGYGDTDGLVNGVIISTSGMGTDFNSDYRYVGDELSEINHSA